MNTALMQQGRSSRAHSSPACRQSLHLQPTSLHARSPAVFSCRFAVYAAPVRRFLCEQPISGLHTLSGPAARHGRRSVRVSAVFERFTERAIKSVMLSQQEAKAFGVSEVSTEHILLGLVAEESSRAGYLSTKITLDRARAAVKALTGSLQRKDVKPQELPFGTDAKRVFEAALMESKQMGMNFITPEHIFVALLSLDNVTVQQVVASLGADADNMKSEALKRLKREQEGDGEGRKKLATTVSSKSRTTTKALEEFCRDLTEEARQGHTDPVIGRDREVMRVSQILARRRKNNPILLGEPGVGKTAIAEGLANAIASGLQADGTPLPEFLIGKRVMALDMGLMIAGAKERGEMESRVSKMLAEIKDAGNIILMIDEVHTIVGAGAVARGGGGLDVANLLKPALARGELQCIGATTLDEHRKHIEKDAALERRFQPVLVGEPTEAEALEILEGLKEHYERHHRCVYDSGALDAAVQLSSRYIADRFLPDKAIDLIDEAGSRARIAAYRAASEADLSVPVGVTAVQAWRELQEVMQAKEEAVKASPDISCRKGGLFEEAQLLRERELECKARLVGAAGDGSPIPFVSAADVEVVVSAWTGIPLERLCLDDCQRLLDLGDALRERVVGQDDAVDATARAMRRARSGIKDPDRPIASMLFAGPTGVGKTELTKVLARHYFGSEAAMIRLDMSEYMERHTISKLVGAPPGYVGYGEGGKLTEAVRRRPFSIILLDEIEKAHPDVFNILLQIMEDGRLTDSQGRVVSFKNTLLVMTSNIGSNVIAKGASQLGFSLATGDAEEQRYDRVKALVSEELKNYFRPELLNRLDEIVVFRQLGCPEVRVIADLVLAETTARLAQWDIALDVSPRLMDLIVETGYDQAYGARPLKRAVMHLIDDNLSDELLHQRLAAGDTAYMDCTADGTVTVSTQPPEQARADEEAPEEAGGLLSAIVYSNVAPLPKKSFISVNA